MNHHLSRTRSQHFVGSPRRVASPLKLKHSSALRLPLKRRRLGSTATFAASKIIDVDDDGVEIASPAPADKPGGRRRTALSAEVGASNANRSRTRRRDPGPSGLGRSSVEVGDVFLSTDDEASPRKRKRSERDSGSASAAETGSWVEVDEDEEEPEFIAESDQHLLEDAPAYALHRLRKAELIRLWKVAGMWSADDRDATHQAEGTNADEEDGGLGKKDLVDGLIAARKTSTDRILSPIPSPRNSPRRKDTLESAFEIKCLRSASGSVPHSTGASSSSSNEHSRARVDTDATPRAAPRTRSKSAVRNRLSETALLRSTQRRVRDRVKGRPNGHGFRTNIRNDDRKARFGDAVKSPANGLVRAHRSSKSSVSSSAYTTTDTSPPATGLTIRQTPRRRRQSASARKASSTRNARRIKANHESEVEMDGAVEGEDMTAESDEADYTPLTHRLRSRGNGNLVKDAESELEADGEEDDEDEEDDGHDDDDDGDDDDGDNDGEEEDEYEDDQDDVGGDGASPRPRSGRRADPRGLLTHRPTRRAKKRAIEALRNGDGDGGGDEDDEEEMAGDLDEEETGEMDVDDGAALQLGVTRAEGDDDRVEEPSPPTSGRLTRSQHRSIASSEVEEVQPRRLTRRASQMSQMSMDDAPAPTSSSSALTPLSEDTSEDQIAHTTRSGKAFGYLQSRRRRLRQEAIDDPDMEVDDEDDVVEDDDTEADDDSFEPDVDLAEATVMSLTRLLRDELVQLCEARGIAVGGTKPQLARALIEWRDEQQGDAHSTTSSQATARPSSPRVKTRRKVIHAIASNKHVSGKTTPVLLRDHFHATDPATPPLSDSSKPSGEAELNLDLSELGLEDSMIKPEHLVKLEKIGSGGFKDVYIGKLRGRKVAISEFRGHLSEMDIRELKLLAEFSHPNIVRFRGICIPEDSSQIPCMLVSELCENGDLFDYIRNVPPQPLKRVLGLMLDIARGLEYLHTRKPAIIHRDCKSSNILINRAGQAKVGDFGLARVKTSTRSMIRSLVGTVNWQAPELWHPQPRYDYKVDVFSAGCVYWEMLAGWGVGDKKYPWEGHNEHYIYDAVGAKHRRPSIVGLRKAWGAEPVNLMERMWHQDPGERPTMTDVVADLEAMIADL